MILRLFQFALVLVLLVVVAMVSALTTMHFAIHGAEVKVPDFRGMGSPSPAPWASYPADHMRPE